MKCKTCFFLMMLLACNQLLHATTRKVLFIGNSYTYTNNMPLMVQTMATSLGDTLIFDASDPGGYTLAMQCVYAPTIAKIYSQQWDIVVLQEQSELPAFPPDQVDTGTYPYAHTLDSMIHANDSCTQTMFLMTWGRANGDPLNCGSYPIICSYEGMQMRLRESYLQMTQANNAIVAPVGVAWHIVMDSIPGEWLYISDSSHPNLLGSYLESCVIYSSIFHRHTTGCSYTDGLTTGAADTLQSVSDRVVFDSLAQWQQYGHYPFAGFIASGFDSAITLTNSDPINAGNYWNFGDGNSDTASNTNHNYASTGNYVISHTAFNECFSETMTDTIHTSTAGLPTTLLPGQMPVVALAGNNGAIAIRLFSAENEIDLYNATGNLIKRFTTTSQLVNDYLLPGLYCFRIHDVISDRYYLKDIVVY